MITQIILDKKFNVNIIETVNYVYGYLELSPQAPSYEPTLWRIVVYK